MKASIIAIDGPAGAGKSTVAKFVAKRLNYVYIDTGAMYRAVAWAAQDKNISPANGDAMAELTRTLSIQLYYRDGQQRITVDGRDVSEEIRTPDISRIVSAVSAIPAVRNALLDLQRQMARAGGVVMDGRDIGTCVLPNADVKIFLTASIDERARRRCLELQEKGFVTDLEQLKQEIALRDKMDSERELAPLRQADDATLIDTSDMTIEQAVDAIITKHEKRYRP
ncbi:MAG: cmk [Anaerosporomusa subterranea]|jgi:cytidylate kinase|nr:cmk [Anaerosporomusa subterranea]